MVDTGDLKSLALRRAGSSPDASTINNYWRTANAN